MCKRFLGFFGIFLASAIIFSFCSGVDASADTLSGGKYLTTEEALQIFGNTIDIEYYNGTNYVTAQAEYSGVDTISSVSSSGSYTAVKSGAQYLKYFASGVSYTNTQGMITVKAKPRYCVYDTSMLYTFIGVSSHQTIAADAYMDPQWDWSIGHYENHDVTSGGKIAYFTNSSNWPYFSFVEVCHSANQSFSTYCGDAEFYGNTHNGYSNVTIAIGIPYVSNDSSYAFGTLPATTAPSGSGSTNVNVDVDMSETNGLLGWIFDGISGIPDAIMSGIRSIFVPDSEYVVNKIVEMRDYFAWYDEFSRVGQIFKTHFQTTSGEAPVVRLTAFSTASGTYLSTNEFVLDMAPFEDYLPSIKAVISIWLWVTFLWSLYCRLPDIINGAGILVFNQSKIDDWRAKHNDCDSATDISDSIDTCEFLNSREYALFKKDHPDF